MKINPRIKNLEAIKSLNPEMDEKDIDSILKKYKILISIPKKDEISNNDREIISVLLNLLPRVFSKVYILHGKKIVEEFPKSHQSKIKNVSNLQNPDINIIVGNSNNCIGSSKLYVNSSGWSAFISHKNPCNFLKIKDNPIGAILSGALCVGEVFKIAFSDYLTVDILDTLTYDPITHGSAKQPVISPDISKTIHVRDLTLVGLGGVGQGVLYCLRKLPLEIKSLLLIDKDLSDESNEQRYILSYKENRNRPKVNIARDHVLNILKIKNLNSYAANYEEFLKISGLFRPRLSNVIVTVDNIETRKNVQASLPKRIINGWTETDNQNLAYGISVHNFDSDYQCLACAYFSEKAPSNQIEFYSMRTGFSIPEVKKRIDQNIPLTKVDIEQISETMGIDSKRLEQHIGHQLEDVIHGQCGTFTIPMKNVQAIAPVPHIPLLVAIHLSTQLILPYLKANRRVHNVESAAVFYGLKNPNSLCLEYRLKNERCFCNDPIYQEVYKRKWKERT